MTIKRKSRNPNKRLSNKSKWKFTERECCGIKFEKHQYWDWEGHVKEVHMKDQFPNTK